MGKTQSRMRRQMLTELMNSTYFTKKEIQKWYKGFMHDAPSGKLTLENITQILRQSFGLGLNEDDELLSEVVFKTLDENRDGVVDFKEFMIALDIIQHGGADGRLAWVFKIYDLDGDGFLSRNEMLEFVNVFNRAKLSIGQPPSESAEERTKALFDLMNTDVNDKVSLENFIDGAKKDREIMTILVGSPSASSTVTGSPTTPSSPEAASPKAVRLVRPVAALPKAASPMDASPETISPRTASPMVGSPDAGSPKNASPMVLSPEETSPMIASSETDPFRASASSVAPPQRAASPMAISPTVAPPEAASLKLASPMAVSSEGASSETASPMATSSKAESPVAASSGSTPPDVGIPNGEFTRPMSQE